jgi:hypothetical protein
MSEQSSIADHIPVAGKTAAENSVPKFSFSALAETRIGEIAMRGNGYVLAASGGIAVCAGALLPFTWHAQASVDGAQVLSGFGIGLGYRVISFLFGALLAGLAYWTRRNPARLRPIAMAALIIGVLGFAGYFLYTLIGINGLTVNSDLGPAHVSWYPASAC